MHNQDAREICGITHHRACRATNKDQRKRPDQLGDTALHEIDLHVRPSCSSGAFPPVAYKELWYIHVFEPEKDARACTTLAQAGRISPCRWKHCLPRCRPCAKRIDSCC